MSISSSELNYLIWRYLQESGFAHSTYAFQNETQAHTLDQAYGPVTEMGTLVNVLQKGLQYMEIEASLNPDGTEKESTEPFSLFKNVGHQYKRTTQGSGINGKDTGGIDTIMAEAQLEDEKILREISGKVPDATSSKSKKHRISEGGGADSSDGGADEFPMEEERKRSKLSRESKSSTPALSVVEAISNALDDSPIVHDPEHVFSSGGSGPSILSLDAIDKPTDCQWVSKEELAVLSPLNGIYLYSCPMSDSTAQLKVKVHIKESDELTSFKVTKNGEIVYGTFSGLCRVYKSDGSLLSTLRNEHNTPVLACEVIHINGKNMVLSIDCLRRAVLWEVDSGDVISRLEYGNEQLEKQPTADMLRGTTADVKVSSNNIAAVTRISSSIALYDLRAISAGVKAQVAPHSALKGHTETVNVLHFTTTEEGTELLVSGSADNTVRLWNVQREEPRLVLEGHQSPVINIRSTSKNKNIIASGDVKGKVLVWDIVEGMMMRNIDYTLPVYSFDFFCSISRDSKNHSTVNNEITKNDHVLLLTGSRDGVINVWQIASASARDSSNGANGVSGRSIASVENFGIDSILSIQCDTQSGQDIAIISKEQSCVLRCSE
ncbi:WD40-repeat-containing domain protein [Dipodascopsis uninucleata]